MLAPLPGGQGDLDGMEECMGRMWGENEDFGVYEGGV